MTKDGKFIIKSMFPGEVKVMMQIIDDYEQHFEKNNKSLLARIYGIY